MGNVTFNSDNRFTADRHRVPLARSYLNADTLDYDLRGATYRAGHQRNTCNVAFITYDDRLSGSTLGVCVEYGRQISVTNVIAFMENYSALVSYVSHRLTTAGLSVSLAGVGTILLYHGVSRTAVRSRTIINVSTVTREVSHGVATARARVIVTRSTITSCTLCIRQTFAARCGLAFARRDTLLILAHDRYVNNTIFRYVNNTVDGFCRGDLSQLSVSDDSHEVNSVSALRHRLYLVIKVRFRQTIHNNTLRHVNSVLLNEECCRIDTHRS